MTAKLTNMTKDGVVLGVHETCVDAHVRQGWAVTEQKATPVAEAPEDDALMAARAEYKDLVGKKAHHSWDVEQIKAKLSELTDPAE